MSYFNSLTCKDLGVTPACRVVVVQDVAALAAATALAEVHRSCMVCVVHCTTTSAPAVD